ncbi:iron complex transport system ATP-binding protein [Poseidonocella pacifica]|uniref:Iron complex transport system ATP-binding protein n=1 Tax=Poseidonocella pacifica TaxID=871651 RepID=A0A1I0V522_9RHOB|nr:ABC transporter ATP-binding protein [Poseidonocella pacifica]SFA71147.1 iron complex transport system ATP-binding protein [Poseidonocella pacifica]
MTLLTLTDLTVRRGDCPVVDGVSFTLGAGEFVGLIGPNGAGKTSLLRGALGLLPHEGHSSVAELPPGPRSRHVAFLPQAREIAWPMQVADLVRLGRHPHDARAKADADAVDRALRRMGLADYAPRLATQLSGGEQARVLIARALAQETPLILADEPVAGLDPAAQIAAARVFADLAGEGHAVLASLHDLGLAARHCTRLLLMDRGRLVADGPPSEVLTPQNLRDVFGITAHFQTGPEGPIFQPLDRVRPQ